MNIIVLHQTAKYERQDRY